MTSIACKDGICIIHGGLAPRFFVPKHAFSQERVPPKEPYTHDVRKILLFLPPSLFIQILYAANPSFQVILTPRPPPQCGCHV